MKKSLKSVGLISMALIMCILTACGSKGRADEKYCGNECGVMSRTKIKKGYYLCDSCGDLCSKYIRLSELTLDEIKGHIEYMKRQNRLFEEVYSKEGKKETIPLTIKEAGIEFCDDLGMFRIKYKNFTGRGKMNELFRYDQVASYEEYYDEMPSSEPGKTPEFKGGGLKIKLLNKNMEAINIDNKKGLHSHPYIKQEIKVCFSKKSRTDAEDAHHEKCKFDYIFGIHDNSKGLFDFGLSKEEKRELQGAVGMANIFGGAETGNISISQIEGFALTYYPGRDAVTRISGGVATQWVISGLKSNDASQIQGPFTGISAIEIVGNHVLVAGKIENEQKLVVFDTNGNERSSEKLFGSGMSAMTEAANGYITASSNMLHLIKKDGTFIGKNTSTKSLFGVEEAVWLKKFVPMSDGSVLALCGVKRADETAEALLYRIKGF